MNIVIIGRGAIGLLLAHIFKNNDISFKVRQSPTHINADTFSFTNILGKSEQQQYQIADQQELSKADVIICCVKSYDVKVAIASLIGKISGNIPILLAHNGMGVSEELAALPIQNPIFGLLSTMGARRLSQNHVIHTGLGKNQIGLIRSATQIHDTLTYDTLLSGSPAMVGKHSARFTKAPCYTIKALGKCLSRFEYSPKFTTLQWHKLAVNCAINGLTAIHNIANGALTNLTYRSTIEEIIAELVMVANRENITLKTSTLLNEVYEVVNLTAANSSSMREDINNRRRSEIDYINGYIIALGRKHSIATPANLSIYNQVKQLTDNFI